jgi:NAD(P)-dependent dehydrogenase (short-subunit alcohol dehydrogenase family)
MDLSNASVIVSGGAGGLGEATVRAFAARGVATVIADLDDDRGQALASELSETVRYVRTDVTDEASTLAAIAAANEMAPLRVSVAAHGAGAAVGRIVNRDGEPLALEGFRRTVDVYLTGTFNLLRLAAASMSRSEPDDDGNRGVLISTASIAAYEGQIGQAAVVGLTLSAARDLAAAGVRVVTIAPGTFFTPAFRLPEEEAQKHWGVNVPFPNRMGRPAEYASLVEHIAANDYLNGEVIRLDGAIRFGPK